MTGITLVFAEFFGKNAVDVAHFQSFFSGAAVSLTTEVPEPIPDKAGKPLFDKSHPRYGWRMNDYWKVRGLLDSPTRFAISFDADTRIVSEEASALITLTERFGLCLPTNPRRLVKVDTLIGADSDKQLDESLGLAHAVNMTPIAVDLNNPKAVALLEHYLLFMENEPVRGPLAMWRAIWMSGFHPCLLPAQWCVCAKDVGIGGEIILHTGHEEVERYYRSYCWPKERAYAAAA